MTEDEHLGLLDERLDAALAEFDELLLAEQRRLAEQGGPMTGAMTGAGEWGAGNGSSGPGATGAGSARSSGAGAGSTGAGIEADNGAPETRAGGGTGTSGAPPVPPDVGDGAGDDIIARQLREAALAETDPELRAKLWDEYRRYKESIRGD